MPDPSFTVTVSHVRGADADAMSVFFPIPGLGSVPINSFVLHAAEPVLVDTGAFVFRPQLFDALKGVIDPRELRWVYLTHTDADHIGGLGEVLAAAPNATLVTTYLGLGKLGLTYDLSPDRVFLLNPGQRLRVGDRELLAIETPTFDAPETTGFVDSKTKALFSSDSFGAILDEPAERAGDIHGEALRRGVVTWTTLDSPWLADIEPKAFERRLARIGRLSPPIILSSHLPPAFGMTETLLAHLSAARAEPRFVGPDHEGLQKILAAARPPGPPSPRARV